MIWNWIKNLFKPKEQKDPHEEMFEKMNTLPNNFKK